MTSDLDTPGAFSLDLGPDLREMRDWVHGFAVGTIRPAASEWDEREETPWPVLEEAAKVGEWLPQMFGGPGDVKLGSFCASEPDAGSDIGSIRTRAEYRESTDEWLLNGTKAWATNGGIADVHVIVASVDPSLGTRGQASFIVPPGTPGLS